MGKVKFPSIAAVAAELREINGQIESGDTSDADPEEYGVDIRLQVYASGEWAIHVGDSSYDQDHRGFWGSSSLDGRRFNSEAVARDLIEQARDMHAQGE